MNNYERMAVESCINTLNTLGLNIKEAPTEEIKENAVHVQIEFIGDIKGYVILETSESMACQIANTLMAGMMTVERVDEMTISVISEVCNMISGNLSTAIANEGYTSDIKPPIVDIRDKALPATKGTSLKYISGDGNIINAYFLRIA